MKYKIENVETNNIIFNNNFIVINNILVLQQDGLTIFYKGVIRSSNAIGDMLYFEKNKKRLKTNKWEKSSTTWFDFEYNLYERKIVNKNLNIQQILSYIIDNELLIKSIHEDGK